MAVDSLIDIAMETADNFMSTAPQYRTKLELTKKIYFALCKAVNEAAKNQVSP